jgi:hypothetical protein
MKKSRIIVLALLLIIAGFIIPIIIPHETDLLGFLSGAAFGGGAGLLITQLLKKKES